MVSIWSTKILRFKTAMLGSDLCDIGVKRAINLETGANKCYKVLAFKNNAPFNA